MSYKFYKHRISTLGELDVAQKERQINFLVINMSSMSYMGADYGPPDPPPKMETFNYFQMYGFSEMKEVREYLEDEVKDSPNKLSLYRVIKVDSIVTPAVKVSITL